MSVIAVIPSRMASTRLPNKPLADIKGKPMVQWVYERAAKAKGVDRVIVATDHEDIAKAVKGFGGDVMMTSPDLQSGTDRVGAVAQSFKTGPGSSANDIYINVQGDEPMIDPKNIEASLELVKSGRFTMATPASKLQDEESLKNPNVVKVLVDSNLRAIYFSRFPIPYSRISGPGGAGVGDTFIPLHHQGIYVYTREILLRFCALPRTHLEAAESLEQLRALYNGIPIGVATVSSASIGVDTIEDLETVRRLV